MQRKQNNKNARLIIYDLHRPANNANCTFKCAWNIVPHLTSDRRRKQDCAANCVDPKMYHQAVTHCMSCSTLLRQNLQNLDASTTMQIRSFCSACWLDGADLLREHMLQYHMASILPRATVSHVTMSGKQRDGNRLPKRQHESAEPIHSVCR